MKENPDFIYICCLFRKYFKAIFNRQEVISHMLSFLRFSVWWNIDLLVLNGMILHKDVNVTASKWVPGSSEVSLVSWAGDLRTGDVQQAEGPQGDVWSEDNEEQDHQLRAEVRWERRQELSWLYIDCSVHISISCQMNFDDYPLDSHACQFQVGSCEYWVVLSLLSLPCSRLRQPGGRPVQLSLHLRRGEAEEPAARHTDRTTTSTLPHSPPPVRSDQTEILHSNFHSARRLLRLWVSSKTSEKTDAVRCAGETRDGDCVPALSCPMSGVSPQRHVRHSELGQFPGEAWSCSWKVNWGIPDSDPECVCFSEWRCLSRCFWSSSISLIVWGNTFYEYTKTFQLKMKKLVNII